MSKKLKIATCVCGSNRRYVSVHRGCVDYRILYCVVCPECKRRGLEDFDSREEAIDQWNFIMNQKKAKKWSEWHDEPYPYADVVT